MMKNKEETLVRERIIAVMSHTMFAIAWFILCVDLLRHWQLMVGSMRFSAISMLVLFGMLWFTLLRESANYWCLFAASLAFASLLDIVPKAL
jgi:hypothetical protein